MYQLEIGEDPDRFILPRNTLIASNKFVDHYINRSPRSHCVPSLTVRSAKNLRAPLRYVLTSSPE